MFQRIPRRRDPVINGAVYEFVFLRFLLSGGETLFAVNMIEYELSSHRIGLRMPDSDRRQLIAALGNGFMEKDFDIRLAYGQHDGALTERLFRQCRITQVPASQTDLILDFLAVA